MRAKHEAKSLTRFFHTEARRGSGALVARRALGIAAILNFALAGLFTLASAAETPSEQKSRVQRIEDAVRAPCCFTDPVSRHQSEAAVKMRMEIAKLVAMGKTDEEILDTYVKKYGAKVLVDPRSIPGWWTPWVPWLTVIAAVLFTFWLLRRWRAKAIRAAPPASSADAAVLPEFDDDV